MVTSGEVEWPNRQGNVYGVKIDVKPEELLDWDKPLSEQGERVMEGLRYLATTNTKIGRAMKDALQDPTHETGESVYRLLTTFSPEHKSLDDDRKYASKILNIRGIAGIRYLDEGSRWKNINTRKVGKGWSANVQFHDGNTKALSTVYPTQERAIQAAKESFQTHNIVVFDDSRVHITHVNGKELSRSEAVAKTKAWQAELHPRDTGGKFAEVDGDGGGKTGAADRDQLTDPDAKAPPQLAGMTKEDFEKGFCAPHNPDIKSDVNTVRPFIYNQRPALFLEGELKSEYGAHVGNFQLRFETDTAGKLGCDFGLLEIHPGYQKEGIGSDFIQQTEKFCKSIGVAHMTLVANVSVGGLAWALQGYDFVDKKNREEVREFCGNAVQLERKAGRLSEAQSVEAIQRVSSLTHSWEFATWGTATDTALGRKCLLRYGKGGGWEGKKNLDSKDLGYRIGQAYQRLKLRRAAGKA